MCFSIWPLRITTEAAEAAETLVGAGGHCMAKKRVARSVKIIKK